MEVKGTHESNNDNVVGEIEKLTNNIVGTNNVNLGDAVERLQVSVCARDVGNSQTRQIRCDADGRLECSVDALEVSMAQVNLNTDQLETKVDAITTKLDGFAGAGNNNVGEGSSKLQIYNYARDVSAGNYKPLVCDGDGHLQVDIVSSTASALPSGASTSAKQDVIEATLTAIETDCAALEVLQTSTNTKLDTLETTLTAIETDAAALEVLQTAGNALLTTIDADTSSIKTDLTDKVNFVNFNVNPTSSPPSGTTSLLMTRDTDVGLGVVEVIGSLSTIDGVLDNILIDTSAIKVDAAALEVLQTSTNTKLDTLETTLTAIETDAAALEVLQTATNSKIDTLDSVLDNILVDTSAIKVDAAALEVLQTSTLLK